MPIPQIRINPDTKQVEQLTPEGIWSSQALEQQMAGIKSQVGAITTAIPSVINGVNIQPTPEIPYVAPQEPPVYNVAGLNTAENPTLTPTLTKTSAETEAQNLTKQLQDLNTSLVGESAYRGQVEQQQGIQEAIQAKNDLTNQLNFLKTEAQQIPLTIQNQFEGRGATVGGVQPIQTAALRNNAIKALGVSALLNAANNNLTTSQVLVDRLVSQKYDPIREEINAKIKNLQLIISSPEFTTAEKNRATQQQAILDAQKERIATQEQNSKDIWDVATSAASNIQSFIPTQRYPTAAVALQAISNASNPQTALQIATETGLTTTIKAETLTYRELPDGRAVMLDTRGNIVKEVAPAPITPEGQPQLITTLAGKPLTDAQSLSLGYAQRMNDADVIITELGDKMTGILSYISGSKFFPNILKSDDRQRYEQAQRNFINAVLRKESGAAISPSEFDSAAKQYFPQAGDSKAVMEQKTANRLRSISNLSQSANVSLESITEQQNIPSVGTYEDYLKAIQ